MAVRSEDLDLVYGGGDAVVYRFPALAARRRARRRMMARRRKTVAALAVVVVATLAGGGVAETAPGARGRRAVSVRPGDTLWGIAGEHAPPGSDVRAYVDALIEVNGLDGPLQAGTRLRLPK